MSKKEIKDMTIEETFDEVEEIMAALQKDDVPLEDSFALYKNGMELIKHCSEVIEKVEKQIIVLSNEEGSEDDD